jgi:hypothetical protein
MMEARRLTERKMKDVECQTMTTTMVETNTSSEKLSYMRLFAFGSVCALFVFCFVSMRMQMMGSSQQDFLSSLSSSSSLLRRHSPRITWHINPIKPLHHGKAVFLTQQSDTDGQVIYKRIFTAPCAYGM